MSTNQDMLECERRDRWGNPTTCPITRPIANVSDTRAPTTTHIDQSTGKNEKLPWISIAMLLAGASLVGMFWSISDARRAERETRMLEYYLLELDAKVIAAGIKAPEDAIAKKLDKQRKEQP